MHILRTPYGEGRELRARCTHPRVTKSRNRSGYGSRGVEVGVVSGRGVELCRTGHDVISCVHPSARTSLLLPDRRKRRNTHMDRPSSPPRWHTRERTQAVLMTQIRTHPFLGAEKKRFSSYATAQKREASAESGFHGFGLHVMRWRQRRRQRRRQPNPAARVKTEGVRFRVLRRWVEQEKMFRKRFFLPIMSVALSLIECVFIWCAMSNLRGK